VETSNQSLAANRVRGRHHDHIAYCHAIKFPILPYGRLPARNQDVDGRVKPGHDEWMGLRDS
jgi:hypothetical protein